ncbi:MAG: pyruvate kinase, partial [Vampirovibrionia bacterium]
TVAILMDLQGPKIRVGKMENNQPVQLIEGNEITISSDDCPGNQDCISTNYPELAKDVKIGDKILLNDGLFILEVIDITDNKVKTKIIAGGELTEHKGVNLPGTTTSIQAMNDKDKEDAKFAVENDVDFLGLSFVRSAGDVKALKDYIKEINGNTPVISKIEKPEALKNIEEIINLSDGIMVARGDLGIELAPHKVPLAQKEIISLANINNTFVITATQMLESMIQNPIPSRAETSDVANAILDGTDAIMLSGETSVGKYPIQAVKMMDTISREIETHDYSEIKKNIPKISDSINIDSHAIALSAFEMSKDLNPKAIITFTNSGFSARLLSNFRPNVPIIALTHQETVSRKLAGYWGVYPFVLNVNILNKQCMEEMDELLKEKTLLKSGDKIIITGSMPFLITGITNFIRVHIIDA